ncbi:MAG: SLBB domain-containing protein [SAR86 cluster bacterium]|nr:SLBB domain-containing protein [SAR86 cluster bacterium]
MKYLSLQNKLYKLIFPIFFITFLASSQELPTNFDELDQDLLLQLKRDVEESKSSIGQELDEADFAQNDLSIDSELQDDEEDKEQEVQKSKIFGHDYIRSVPKSISGTSDLPVPNDYLVSLGDEINVVLSGSKDALYFFKVGLDGAIQIPEVGTVNVFGQTIQEVKALIKNLVSLVFAGTEVTVSLGSISAKKINILGAVKNPGSYLVNPFSTVFTSLAYAGGFEEYASLRNVTLIRGKKRISIDMYDFLIFGDRDVDINLQQGDTILIGSSANFIDISGAVNREFIYEYISTDTVNDLLTFSQGLTKFGNKNEIALEELKGNNRIAYKASLAEEIGERTITRLRIGRKSVVNNLGISIEGNGVEERFFLPSSFKNLNDLVSSLEFSDDIYPFYAKLEQDSEKGMIKEVISFSILDVETQKNIELKNNVKLTFMSREDIDNIQSLLYFSLQQGENLSNTTDPSKFDYLQNVDQEILEDENLFNILKIIQTTDLLTLSIGNKTFFAPAKGTFTPRALFNYFGFDQSVNESTVTISTKTGLLKSSFNLEVSADDVNQINFPESKVTNFLLEISGQVNNPGTFTVNSGMTLQEAYDMAGGFTEKADTTAIIFTRKSIIEKERISTDRAKRDIVDSIISQFANPINSTSSNLEGLLPLIELVNQDITVGRLTGRLEPGSSNANSITLEPGDKIFIPSVSNSITVLGEVLQPITTIFQEGKNFQYYLESAGNYTEYADKSSIFIIKSNGTSEPVPLRKANKYILQPGDTIVIPKNIDKINTLPLVSTSVKILSDIAFAAASLNILRN